MEIQHKLIAYYFEEEQRENQADDITGQKMNSNNQQRPLSQSHTENYIHRSHINSTHLLIIRACAFCYLTGIFIWAIVYERTFLFNIIYLTMQGYFMTWLYFGLALQDYFFNIYCKNTEIMPKSPNLRYLVQVTSQIAFCAQLPITIIFWVFLFQILLNMEGMTTQILIQNANLHAGPLICLVIDLAYNPFQYKLRRYSIVVIFGTVYLLINCVYSLNVAVIYRPIDWVSWLSYALVIASYAMSFLCHFLGRILYVKIKQKRFQEIHQRGQNSIQITNIEQDIIDQTLRNQEALLDNHIL